MLGKTSTIKTSLRPRYDADQTVWLQVQAHGDLTAKTPYKIIFNEYGHITAALASDAKVYYVGVPKAAVDSGDVVWIQIGGPLSDMVVSNLTISVGHGLSITGGAVADENGDYSGEPNEFAVVTAAASNSDTADVLLAPKLITAATS